MITSKHGQPSTYSPNTQNVQRRRMGSLFGAPISSPLATACDEPALAHHGYEGAGETCGESPTKAGSTRDSSINRTSLLARRSFSRSLTTGTDDSGCSREDEGCFVPATKKAGGDAVSERDTSEMGPGKGGMATLPDEIVHKIISHLPRTAHQLTCLTRVDRRFAEIARANRFWSEVYYETCGYEIEPSVRHRIRPTSCAPAGCWTSEGWVWRLDGEDQGAEMEQGVLTGGLRLAEGASMVHEGDTDDYVDPDKSWMSMTSPAKASSDTPTTPDKSRPYRSRSAPIEIHYPTLVRSRMTLSRLLRDPSPLHRPSFETLGKHTDSVYCLHAVGRWLITGSRDRSIRLWRLGAFGPTGQAKRTRLIKTIHDAHQGSVLAVHFELDESTGTGTLVAASSDSSVSVWDLDFSLERSSDTDLLDGREDGGSRTEAREGRGKTRAPTITRRKTLNGHTAGVLDTLLTPSFIVSGSKDTTIRVYDRTSGRLMHVLQGHVQPVNCLAFRPAPKASHPPPSAGASSAGGNAAAGKEAEQVVSAGADGNWIIWDLHTGLEIRRKESPSGLACVAWQGDYIVTGDNDHLVRVYDANSSELLRAFKGHKDLIRTIDINLQEELVISGSYDKSIIIWDLHTGEMLRRIASQHTSLVFDLQATTTRLISASHDKSIQVISLVTGLPYLDTMA